MQNEIRNAKVAAVATVFFLLTLLFSGCGGGGSSHVTQAPPSMPTGVYAVVSASNAITISWNSVVGAASYNIYMASQLGVTKKNYATLSDGAKYSSVTGTYTRTSLSSGKTYYFVVTAVNGFGESSESITVFALLTTPQPPGALAAVAGNGQATVSWNTNGAASYNIYMASQPGVTKANYGSLTDGAVYSSTTGTATLTGLTNGKTYYFVVTSFNGFFGESSESSEVAATPAASGSPAVTGLVKYEDKEYGTGGFTGKTYYKAVRYAEVEAVDSSNGLTVAVGTTDVSGSYNLTLPSASTFYIRVISSAASPASSTTALVAVKDLSNTIYAVAGSNFTASGAAIANISIPTTSPAGGAFNMLDVFTSGAQFYQSVAGKYPPALAAFWNAGNSLGTYYCSGTPDLSCPYGEGIYVLNYWGDTDEYDDDVLWHEFGHFIANHFSKDDSPGGAHGLPDNDLDLRLAWSEGWGDFSPTSVKGWLSVTTPPLLSTVPGMATNLYVDTNSAGGSYFDFGNPGSAEIYSSNEAAVTKVLIGLRTQYGMQSVWDTFTSTALKNSAEQVNLEVFYDAWNSLLQPDITAILAERSILYSADAYETVVGGGDNTPNSSRLAALNTLESHTLFGSADVDYVAFSAVQGSPYTATTSALKNGADTYIEIIGPDLSTVVVASNDNANGKNYSGGVPNNCDQSTGVCHENGFDILGSKVSFTPAASGTYYVKVMSSPNRPLSAGKYGDYSLAITSP